MQKQQHAADHTINSKLLFLLWVYLVSMLLSSPSLCSFSPFFAYSPLFSRILVTVVPISRCSFLQNFEFFAFLSSFCFVDFFSGFVSDFRPPAVLSIQYYNRNQPHGPVVRLPTRVHCDGCVGHSGNVVFTMAND